MPALPLGNDGPVFTDPWQAQAFAMVVELVQAGRFSWQDWAAALGKQLKDAEYAGHPDDGSRYYHHWVAALESLLENKNFARADQLIERKKEWADAYRNTPHGKPVSLSEPD